jgi:DNA-binding SARP family transcriptional activator
MGDLPRFQLLGAVQVWRDGEEVDLGGPLQRALLACLLLSVGRVVSREDLIDALWETEPPPRAARSLETKVSRLRAALGDSVSVVARGGGYMLDAPSDELDVHRFERALEQARSLLAEDPSKARARLEAALALWRGHAMGGVPEGALAVERARLEDERLEALEARIDADLALGEAASLVGELQAIRLEHPARERFTEQLMLALYRSGRQADALETYRAAYRDLQDELGLEPGPRLRDLQQAILRHDESLGPLPPRARLRGRSPRRRRALALVALGCVLSLGLVAVARTDRAHQGRQPLRPGLILVDAASRAVRVDVPVGGSQGITRFVAGHLWTLGDNGVMADVDLHTGALVKYFRSGCSGVA